MRPTIFIGLFYSCTHTQQVNAGHHNGETQLDLSPYKRVWSKMAFKINRPTHNNRVRPSLLSVRKMIAFGVFPAKLYTTLKHSSVEENVRREDP